MWGSCRAKVWVFLKFLKNHYYFTSFLVNPWPSKQSCSCLFSQPNHVILLDYWRPECFISMCGSPLQVGFCSAELLRGPSSVFDIWNLNLHPSALCSRHWASLYMNTLLIRSTLRGRTAAPGSWQCQSCYMAAAWPPAFHIASVYFHSSYISVHWWKVFGAVAARLVCFKMSEKISSSNACKFSSVSLVILVC